MRDVSSISNPSSTIGVRVNLETDTNSDGKILNKSAHKAHATTIQQLVDADMRVIVFAHHRTERNDIMKQHTNILREHVDADRVFLSETSDMSTVANQVQNSEVAVYPNLYNHKHGLVDYESPEASRESPLATEIAEEIDAFVSDAFSISHRNYPTVTGVPYLVPGYAGKVMKSEYEILKIFENRNPIFVFGGNKINRRVDMIGKVLKSQYACEVIVGGLVSSVFLLSKGYDVGEDTKSQIDALGNSDQVIDKASDLITKFGDKIYLPEDIAVELGTNRKEFSVSASPFPESIADIGQETVAMYQNRLEQKDTAIGIGPLGVAERERFTYGTYEIYDQLSKIQISAIYGDSTAQVCDDLGITGFSHTSRGDVALCEYLSSDATPASISVLLPEDSTIDFEPAV